MQAFLAVFLSWFMLSAGCSLAAEALEGFQLPKGKATWLVPASFGLVNLAMGWVTSRLIGTAPFWQVPLLVLSVRCPADAALLQLLRYSIPGLIQARHFGGTLLAALVMSAFGTAGETSVHIGFALVKM